MVRNITGKKKKRKKKKIYFTGKTMKDNNWEGGKLEITSMSHL